MLDVIGADPGSPEAAALLEASWSYLASLYKPEERFHLDLEGLRQPHIRFFVGRIDSRAVGCVALALFGSWGEVKSMYVEEAARGSGMAAVLLGQVEIEARAAGCHTLRLETGITLARALAFYERHGFQRRGPFGNYQPIPTSVFMEKPLLPASSDN